MDADTDETTEGEECGRPGDGGNAECETFSGSPQTDSGEGGDETLGRSGYGCVYFIETHDSRYVKIGFSANVPKRLHGFGVQMPGLRLIGYIPGNRQTECWLHGKFADLRERGEWFRNDDALGTFIVHIGLIKPEPAKPVIVAQKPILKRPALATKAEQKHCLRCGNIWRSRLDRPRQCPHCHQNRWDIPSKWAEQVTA